MMSEERACFMIHRKVLPMGHGLCICEEFQFAKSSFFAVYDCGSSTFKNIKIQTNIINTYIGTFDIDVLFLSHFHADHVNAAHLLNPKRVFVPFLSPQQKLLLSLEESIYGRNIYNWKLIEAPESVFPNAEIYRVLPDDFEDIRRNEDNTPVRDLEISNESTISPGVKNIKSGGKFSVKINNENIWEYLIWNPYSNKYLYDFQNKVNNLGLDIKELSKPNNGMYIQNNSLLFYKDNLLTKIYKALKNFNSHSLQVYSGELLDFFPIYMLQGMNFSYVNNKGEIFCNITYDYDFIQNYTGALFMGDIEVDKDFLYKYTNVLGYSRIKKVSFIQIPHHGAMNKSTDPTLLMKYFKGRDLIFIISCKEPFSKHHPSRSLLSHISSKGFFSYLVTNNPKSFFCYTVIERL